MSRLDQETLCTGRCYCGASCLFAEGEPEIVTYCHCSDCRRATGAPVAAFAQFPESAVKMKGPVGTRSHRGVSRQFCTSCGSPLTARFDYLPGRIYLAVGCLDAAAELTPELHCHFDARLPWLCIKDDLARIPTSGRRALNDRSVTE